MDRPPKPFPEIEPCSTVSTDCAPPDISPRRDVHTVEQRSFNMSRIRGKNTGPERLLACRLARKGLSWEGHSRDLPGRPDFVFRDARVAVFVDGDFWHGWRFADWQPKLAPFWQEKIAATMKRDVLARRALGQSGWYVVRIWEHQLKADPARCVRRVSKIVASRAPHGRGDLAFSGGRARD